MTRTAPPPIPAELAHLRLDRHARPVPWFVHVDADGVPDFRVIGASKLLDAHRFGLCWACGRRRGRHAAFVIGPMCAVNRVSAEPPSHLSCAIYSAKACPFLATPSMVRRTRGLPDLDASAAGMAIERNPGVAVVWSSRTWAPFQVPPSLGPSRSGVLWNVGDPSAVRWYANGRDATHGEVLAAIDSGLPILEAEAERQGPSAVAELERMHQHALTLLPAEGVAAR